MNKKYVFLILAILIAVVNAVPTFAKDHKPCGVERYFDNSEDGWIYQQKVPGPTEILNDIDFDEFWSLAAYPNLFWSRMFGTNMPQKISYWFPDSVKQEENGITATSENMSVMIPVETVKNNFDQVLAILEIMKEMDGVANVSFLSESGRITEFTLHLDADAVENTETKTEGTDKSGECDKEAENCIDPVEIVEVEPIEEKNPYEDELFILH